MADQSVTFRNLAGLVGPPLITLPGRTFVFTQKDLEDYLQLVAEAVPDLGFTCERSINEKTGEPPPILRIEDLGDMEKRLPGEPCDIWLCAGDIDNVYVRGERYWKRGTVQYPNGYLQPATTVRPIEWIGETRLENEIQSLWEGRLFFRALKADQESVRLVRRLVRMIGKVATNRFQIVRLPSMEVVKRSEKGGYCWIGRDAMRWAREKPNRVFTAGMNVPFAFRPLDE